MDLDRLRADLAAAIDVAALVADVSLLVAAGPDEVTTQAAVAEIATRLGLEVQTTEEDLEAVRRRPGYPGEEVHRERLVSVTATARGKSKGAPRLCLNGHVDVVPPGEQPWTTPPFVPHVANGRIHGRGAADMKGGVVAALHAAADVKKAVGGPPGDVVVHCVVGEEDGGIGAFALLERDHDFAGCVISEPTGGAVVCAQAGALTWRTHITGRAGARIRPAHRRLRARPVPADLPSPARSRDAAQHRCRAPCHARDPTALSPQCRQGVRR